MKIFQNLIIYLNELLLSSSFDSWIIQLKQNSNLILHSKSSIIKVVIIIKGKKKYNLKINGIIGLVEKLNILMKILFFSVKLKK